jgi:DNA-binding HxlR family transcriptional regulator
MVRRTSHRKAGCSVARTLDVVGDGWSLLIVRDAFEGLTRFGEFQKSLGLAKNILSARLRDLVKYGVFKVVPSSDGSPYNAYVLTEKGQGLRPVLVALGEWGEKFFLAHGDDYFQRMAKTILVHSAELSRGRSKGRSVKLKKQRQCHLTADDKLAFADRCGPA